MNARTALVDSARSGNPVADMKLEMALDGLPDNTQKHIIAEFSAENRLLLAEFLNNFVTHENITAGTKRVYACNLLYLCRFLNHKPFKLVTRDDILAYLQKMRRPLALDPFQKWINTHNNRLVIYQKFFKWLYFPELSTDERRKLGKPESHFKEPDVIRDLPFVEKKEKTHVQAKDLWTPEEDALFLKYCEDPRIQFYHIGSIDTSARPHELLARRIGDVRIKMAGNKAYAELEIGRGGKTHSRTVPLIKSLPYYKALLAVHPEPGNPNAFIFRSLENQSRYRNVSLKPSTINGMYWALKHKFFPKLLERPDVPPEDKARIRELLQKPWNPYIRRHTSLTEKAKLVNEYTLRLHAGWSKSSKMVEIYTHELGGESSKEFLTAYGILPKDGDLASTVLQPKQCPNCNEPNKHDSKFCSKCKMVLSYDAYEESLNTSAVEKVDLREMSSDLADIKAMLREKGYDFTTRK